MERLERRPQAHRAAESLDELLGLADDDFVYCAFWTILGRGAEPGGYNYYVSRLRAGYPKLQILDQFARSAEGRAHDADFTGFRAMLRRYRRSRLPLIGWLFRYAYGLEGDGLQMRRLRSIENRVQVLQYALEQALAKLDQISSSEQMVRIRRNESYPDRITSSSLDGHFTARERRAYNLLADAIDRPSHR